MKFRKAFHKVDADGKQVTVGSDEAGDIWLMSGDSGPEGVSEIFGHFTPADALMLAFELANLARYGKSIRVRAARVDVDGGPE